MVNRGALLDTQEELSSNVISRALGEELRHARKSLRLSRAEVVSRLCSPIGERTLVSYELGARHIYVYRLVELGRALRVDASTMMARALQRARINVDSIGLTIDLHALLNDNTPTFRPVIQWAKNALNENPSGTVEVSPAVVHNLALFIGCPHIALANYLAKFLPNDDDQ